MAQVKAKKSTASTASKRKTAAKGSTKKPASQAADKHAAVREALLNLRDRLTGTVTQLRSQSLTRDDEVNPEEDGSDAFERLFSLERASTDHQVINQIDEALRALDEGTYGLCEMCNCRIEEARMKALPFAKTCVACQSEMERTHRGTGKSRRSH